MLFSQFVTSFAFVKKFVKDHTGDEMAQKAVITIVLVIGVMAALGYLAMKINGLLNGAADGL